RARSPEPAARLSSAETQLASSGLLERCEVRNQVRHLLAGESAFVRRHRRPAVLPLQFRDLLLPERVRAAYVVEDLDREGILVEPCTRNRLTAFGYDLHQQVALGHGSRRIFQRLAKIHGAALAANGG